MTKTVHRAIRTGWLYEGTLTDKAFRRRPKDLDGLSVSSTHDSAKRSLQSGAGVAALAVLKVEQLGLQVACSGSHGTILGLPFDIPENYSRVIEFADRLRDIAEFSKDPWQM